LSNATRTSPSCLDPPRQGRWHLSSKNTVFGCKIQSRRYRDPTPLSHRIPPIKSINLPPTPPYHHAGLKNKVITTCVNKEHTKVMRKALKGKENPARGKIRTSDLLLLAPTSNCNQCNLGGSDARCGGKKRGGKRCHVSVTALLLGRRALHQKDRFLRLDLRFYDGSARRLQWVGRRCV